MKHEWSVRVYYEDTDAGGVVYHTGYLRFMERARTEWLRALGYSQHRLNDEDGLLFTVVSLSIRFIRPARLDDLLLICSSVREATGATVLFEQAILRANETEPLATGEVRVACLDAENFRPRRLPESLREEMIA
jgi:acyl-CoA thioester hydrolase